VPLLSEFIMRPRRAHCEIEFGFDSDEEDVDSEVESEFDIMNEVEFCMFGEKLGVDTTIEPHLRWLVEEAYSSPVPQGWRACDDEEGNTYYYHELTGETTWEHPTDKTYREVLRVIRTLEAEVVAMPPKSPSTKIKMMEIIGEHLHEMQVQATTALEQWSGPHDAGDGLSQFYHNIATGRSTWYSPRFEWEHDIFLQYSLLHRFVSQGMTVDAEAVTPFPTAFPIAPTISRARLFKRRVSFASSGFRTPCSQAPLTPQSFAFDDLDMNSPISCKRACDLQGSSPKRTSPKRISPTRSKLFVGKKTLLS